MRTVRIYSLVVDGEKRAARIINASDFVDESCHGGESLHEFLEDKLLDIFGAEKVEFEFRVLDGVSRVGVKTYTVVSTDRCYGGPEEGGWFYDHDTTVRVFHVPSHKSARFRTRLDTWCRAANKGMHSGDPRYNVRLGDPKPQGRPHYC